MKNTALWLVATLAIVLISAGAFGAMEGVSSKETNKNGEYHQGVGNLCFDDEGEENEHDNCTGDEFILWARKEIIVNITPVDIDYENCTFVGPIYDIIGYTNVNHTNIEGNNDAKAMLDVSAGHLSDWYTLVYLKNPTDYTLEIRLSLNTADSSNLEKCAELWVSLNNNSGSSEIIMVSNREVVTKDLQITLKPLETKRIGFKASGFIDHEGYTIIFPMDEWIRMIVEIQSGS